MANVVSSFNINIVAGGAVAGPPLGPALGQYGVNTASFLSKYNEDTEGLDDFAMPLYLPTTIYIMDNRTVEYKVHKPSTSTLIKMALSLTKGNSYFAVRRLQLHHLFKIALFKFPTMSLKYAFSVVLGTARSLGVFYYRSSDSIKNI